MIETESRMAEITIKHLNILHISIYIWSLPPVAGFLGCGEPIGGLQQFSALVRLLSYCHWHISQLYCIFQGLSKTVQAIALLGYMKDYQHISGPHLFIVPWTDIDHWLAEFKRWSPESRLVVIKDTNEQRVSIIMS